MSILPYIASSDEAHIPLALDGPVGLDARSCCVRNFLSGLPRLFPRSSDVANDVHFRSLRNFILRQFHDVISSVLLQKVS